MIEIETEAKKYAINRRKESYDAESEIFELEIAGVLKPDEIEKVIEDVRIEAFIAGANYFLNQKESIDINWHYNEIPQEPYANLYLIELTSPKGVLEFAEFIPQTFFQDACFDITRSGEYSGKIGLKYIARWCVLKPGKILEHNNTVPDEIRSNLLKLLNEN